MSLRPRSNSEREFDRLLGRQITRARKGRGMSGASLARAVNVSQQRICWIEGGGRCSCFLLVKIAAALNIEASALLADTSLTCYLKKTPARAS
jgi:transcriptional regulator with XRE-family HTH domain